MGLQGQKSREGHKTLTGKQFCEGHMKDNHRNKMGLFLKYQHKPRQFDRG